MADGLGRSVGVMGGGQLGRMMGYAAGRLGVHLVTLDPAGENSPAGVVSRQSLTGSFQEAESVRKLSEHCDVVTAEIEHVECGILHVLEKEGKAVHPSGKVIETIQDKMVQKVELEKHGVEVVNWREVKDESGVESLVNELGGFPAMLKSRKQAYDGRGNAVLSSAADIPEAVATLSKNKGGLYLEQWCPFKAEIAVMVARSVKGEVKSYDVVETRQANNICRVVVAPPSFDLPGAAVAKAKDIAVKSVEALGGVGIFGVEMFWLGDDKVVLNEMAPRPHNSGHYTIEANVTDQFEQHLRAVLDMPLGDTSMRVPACAMVNILGGNTMEDTMHQVRQADGAPGCTVHWYGKEENRLGRKMGHITVTADSMTELRFRLAAIGEALSEEDKSLANGGKALPKVGIIMGSDSDLPTMRAAADFLAKFEVPFELTVVSAHRTPDRMYTYAKEARGRGIKVIIAGAGGAAHLPGMVAALTPLPVIGVPVKTSTLNGNDSLLSIVQMPRGVPVATVAIGNSTNAGLLAVRMLAAFDSKLAASLDLYHDEQTTSVLEKAEKLETIGYEEYLSQM